MRVGKSRKKAKETKKTEV